MGRSKGLPGTILVLAHTVMQSLTLCRRADPPATRVWLAAAAASLNYRASPEPFSRELSRSRAPCVSPACGAPPPQQSAPPC